MDTNEEVELIIHKLGRETGKALGGLVVFQGNVQGFFCAHKNYQILSPCNSSV
jgi:hypothetical protein